MRECKFAPRTGLLAAGVVSGLILASLTGVRTAFAAPALGQAAPAFSLPDARSGAATSLSALEQGKKATVVMFIATRCPYSNAYNDRMAALAAKYASQGVAFVAINSNQTEPTAEVADHARSHGFTFPVLKDADSAVADKYGARVTPEIYLLNASGALVYHGRIDNSADPDEVKTHDLADALDSVLAGKPVARPETKAFGCTIKRG